jgi:hypothetical protein
LNFSVEQTIVRHWVNIDILLGSSLDFFTVARS